MKEYEKIDNEAVKKFFEQRVRKDLPYRYNYVNYQDDNPELVIERDRVEKNLIVPQLEIRTGMKILDIGCGVGRWGDYFQNVNCTYIGVDYSDNLLEIARKHFETKENISFVCAPFQNVNEIFRAQGITCKFDIILVNGVFVYINDDDIERCMENLINCKNIEGKIYIKESVSRKERLTLQKIYSKELGCEYSAIYRSIDEYNAMIRKYLPDCIVRNSGEIWPANMAQRKETTAYYWILTA